MFLKLCIPIWEWLFFVGVDITKMKFSQIGLMVYYNCRIETNSGFHLPKLYNPFTYSMSELYTDFQTIATKNTLANMPQDDFKQTAVWAQTHTPFFSDFIRLSWQHFASRSPDGRGFKYNDRKETPNNYHS